MSPRPSRPTLAIGSLVGSIVANVCLALAVAALIIPLKVDSATVRREAPISVASVVLFAILAVGGVTMVKGLVMLVALGAAVGALLLGQRHRREDPLGSEMAEFASTKTRRSSVESVRAIGMLVFMLGGAEIMVTSSLGVAKHLGFSDGLAGLTLVGIGTSAPLIAASIQAARKGEHDLVVGNVLGGNLFIALGGGAVVGFLASAKSVHVGDVALVLMTVVVVGVVARHGEGGDTPTLGSDRPVARVRGLPSLRQSLTSDVAIFPFGQRADAHRDPKPERLPKRISQRTCSPKSAGSREATPPIGATTSGGIKKPLTGNVGADVGVEGCGSVTSLEHTQSKPKSMVVPQAPSKLGSVYFARGNA